MLNRGEQSRPAGAPENPPQTARVRWSGRDPREATVTARNHAFPVGSPLSFHPADSHPSAVELLLGALGADLVLGFRRAAERRGVSVYALEASVSGLLENPLVALGVVGEEGGPGFAEIACTLYVSAEAEADELEPVWHATLAASPVAHTLLRGGGVLLRLEMAVIP